MVHFWSEQEDTCQIVKLEGLVDSAVKLDQQAEKRRTSMASSRARGKKDDPMVPVYSPNLRAVMADRKLRVADVARRLKEHPQTVAYLAAGEGIKRSRRSRRARLAKLLGVSEQWLAEPTVMIMPLYPPAGSENVFFGTGFPPESPRAQLATTRLLTKCAQACERDLGDPTLRDAGVEETKSPEEVIHYVARFVRQLARVEEWRKELLVGLPDPWFVVSSMIEGGFARSPHLPTDPEEEAASLNLIAAWEQILNLWFTGEAKLNYRRLRENAGFPTPPDERRSDTNPYVIVPSGQEGTKKP